jgi:hypothetical protein
MRIAKKHQESPRREVRAEIIELWYGTQTRIRNYMPRYFMHFSKIILGVGTLGRSVPGHLQAVARKSMAIKHGIKTAISIGP